MTKAKLHSEIQSGLIHVASGDLSVEKCREVIESMIDQYVLQIAEKAMEEEEQYWEGDMTIHYAFDNLLSRIETEIGGK